MISAWYFCISAKADPEQASALLAVLDTLETPEDDELLVPALVSLCNTDAWQQTFALPYVLTCLRTHTPSGEMARAADRYLRGLTEFLADDIAKSFRKLIEALLDKRKTKQLADLAIACLPTIEKLPARQASDRPYIDVRDFLPEIFVLAFLRELAQRGETQLGASEDCDPTAALLDRALQHDLGRLAFLLAIDLEMERKRIDLDQLEQRIWAAPRCTPELEPDLLAALARIFWARSKPEAGRSIDTLIDESILLNRLHAYLAAQDLKHTRNAKLVPDLVKLAHTDESKLLLPVIYWQLVLWEMAIRKDPSASMRRLSDLWRWQSAHSLKVISIYGPLVETAGAWTQRAISLLKLRSMDLPVQVGHRPELSMPPVAAWLLFSPWVQLDLSRELRGKEVHRYPRPLNVIQQVRLFASAVLAVRLLRTLPENGAAKSRQAALPALVAHATDVLSMYDKWMRDKNEPDVSRRLNDPEMVLALFAKRQCSHAGHGDYERITPAMFKNIFELAEREQLEVPDVNLFIYEILPRVLLGWIRDGYATATGDRGTARWFEHILGIYQRYRFPPRGEYRLNFTHKVENTALVRFLVPDYKNPAHDLRLGEFDWLGPMRRNGDWGGGLPRQMLLGPKRRADQWANLTTTNERALAEPDGSEKGATAFLIRATERLAALDTPGTLLPSEQESWRSEWANAMDAIPYNRRADRFWRLRLLELLDSSVLSNDAAGQERIAQVILEFGSPYELVKMLELLYPMTEDGWRLATLGARWVVRASLLRALLNTLEVPTENSNGPPGLQDPFQSRGDTWRRSYLRETVRRVAFFTNPPIGPDAKAILQTLKSQARRDAARATEHASLVSGRIEIYDGRERIILDRGIAEWQITCAVRDPNVPKAAFRIEQYDDTKCRNLFELLDEEIIELSPAKLDEMQVLAIVIASSKDGQECVLNCGLTDYIYAACPNQRKLAPGTVVMLPLRSGGEPHKAWHADRMKPLVPLQRVWLKDELCPASVTPQTGRRGAIVLLQSRFRVAADDPHADWDEDPSRLFAQEPTIAADDKLVRYSKGSWLPVDRGFDQLLATRWTQDEGRLLVLTFLERSSEGAGYRFHRAPGENYRIAEEDLTAEAVDQLEERCRRGRPRELLVTVTPEYVEGRVLLGLAKESVVFQDKLALRRYPDLNIPFDERNLTWRNPPFLSGGMQALAERGDRGWYIPVEPKIPGYPDRISLTWKRGRYPGDQDEQAMVTISAWGPEERSAARVEASALRVLRVDYCSEPRDSFYETWMDLRENDRIWLRSVPVRPNKDGFFMGQTDHNLPVSVEAESITMRYIGEDFRLASNRECVVTNLRDWSKRGSPISIDAAELPPEVLAAGSARGIFVAMPYQQVRASKRLCTILWKLGSAPAFESDVVFEQLPPDLALGMVANVSLVGENQWRLHIETRRFTALGAWMIRQSEVLEDGLFWLGEVDFDGKRVGLAEGQPGKLVLLSKVDPNWRHLALSDGTSFYGGLDPNQNRALTNNQGSGFSWVSGKRQLCRAHLAFDEGSLTGTCDADGQQQKVVPRRIQMRLRKVQSGANSDEDAGEVYLVSRRFDLVAHRPAVSTKTEKTSNLPESPPHAELLAKYFSQPPRILDAEVQITSQDGRTITQVRIVNEKEAFFFPTSDKQWVPLVDVAADEEPWFTGGNYLADNCRVVLKKSHAGGYCASFRDVPPLTASEFRQSETGQVAFHQEVRLDKRLFYVGPESVEMTTEAQTTAKDQISEEGISTTKSEAPKRLRHRFEWGRGYTLLVPEEELLFAGRPFGECKLVLFHGDSVQKVRFLPAFAAPTVGQDEEFAEGCLLSIDDANMEVSQARTLYDQRRKHKIVHLLKVSRKGSTSATTVEVEHVLGFNSASLDAERFFHPSRTRIIDPEQLADVTDSAYVLGRLDEKTFEETDGLTVAFHRVELSLEGKRNGALEPGELIFLRATKTESVSNDVGLRLEPVHGFKGKIGRDLKSLMLLRRRFSVREDLLRRIHQAGLTKEELEDRLLLVQLQLTDKGAVTNIVDSMPPRRPSVLGQGAGRERLILATSADSLAETPDAQELRLELRPGVFVELPLDRADLCDDIVRGDIVRIELVGERYRISRASAGDERFVPANMRPVVMLPKNTLLKPRIFEKDLYLRNNFWTHRRQDFSFGGLPNVEAGAGWRDEHDGQWRALLADGVAHVMETPHPRVGMVARDPSSEERRFWVTPRLMDVCAGFLELDPTTRALRLNPIAAAFDDAISLLPMEIPWTQVSFSDASISETYEQIKNHQWSFHDSRSGHWEPLKTNSGADMPAHFIKQYDLKKSSGIASPLFAERAGGGIRLRYHPTSFLRFGFPASALSAVFDEQRGQQIQFTVAGASTRGGLWLELAPGRLAELPAQLVVFQSRSVERSLSSLDWSAFAPGDRLTLQLASSDPLSIDRFALVKWEPGPRRAFGAAGAVLPVSGHDPVKGELSLGSGVCSLRIPFVAARPPQKILLKEDNTWSEVSRLPEPGETVLLVVNANGQAAVAGYPDLKPVPSFHLAGGFDGDPLGNALSKMEKLMAQPIAVVGGAVPVTVGVVNPKLNVLYFHRALQAPACQLPPGTMGQARVLGLWEDSVVLRYGGGLLLARMGKLISGLPKLFHVAAAAKLRDLETLVWMRAHEKGEVLFRALDNESSSLEIVVEPISVLEAEWNGSRSSGLICRDIVSGALWWMPGRETAWADLSSEELSYLFETPPKQSAQSQQREIRSITAQIILDLKGEAPPYLSIVRAQAVQREFAQLRLGAPLSVRVEKRRDGVPEDPKRHLVRTSGSGMALLLEGQLDADGSGLAGPEINVEVLRRTETPPRIDVVELGKKTFRLDLPQALLQEISQPGTLKARFDAVRDVMSTTKAGEASSERKALHSQPPPELDRKLVALYYRMSKDGLIPEAEMIEFSRVGQAWKKTRQVEKELSLPHALMAIFVLDCVAFGGNVRWPPQATARSEREINLQLVRAFNCTVKRAEELREQHLQQAADLAQDVGRRAVRSWHLERLYREWLQEGKRGTNGLWLRLRQVAVVMGESMKADDLNLVRSLCRAIELRHTEAMLPIAASLRAAIGEAQEMELLISGPSITGRLVALLQSLPERRRGPTPMLDLRHLKALHEVFQALLTLGWSIPLLEPIPRMMETPRPMSVGDGRPTAERPVE